jgi:putative membrane protein
MRKITMWISAAALAAFAVAGTARAEERAIVTNPVKPEHRVKVTNSSQANSPSVRSPLSVPDRKFIERAASDNIAEIEIARLALDQSKNEQVRAFAQMIIDDHEKALDRLKSIANDNDFPIPTEAATKQLDEYRRLAKLSGIDFDREYMKLMSKEHDQAVDAFNKATREVNNPDLREYAQKTLPTLMEHHARAQSLLKLIKA